MPIPDEYRDIFEMLRSETTDGRIQWRPSETSSTSLTFAVADTTFMIWSGTSDETERPFVAMGIRDPKGKLLDTWFVDSGDMHFGDMFEFYSRARRLAHGIPARLALALQALKAEKPPEPEVADDLPF